MAPESRSVRATRHSASTMALAPDRQLLTVSTPRVLVDEVREAARHEGISMNELVRRAIRALLDQKATA